MSNRKKILVTGSNGFIGSNLCEQLRDEYDVVGLDIIPPSKWTKFNGVKYVQGDITDAGDVVGTILNEDPDVVIHLAAIARINKAHRNPKQTLQINTMGTTNILEAIKEYRPDIHMIYASSEIIYGYQNKLPTPEDAPLHPHEPYGVSKAASDMLCQSYKRHYDLNITVARSSMCSGPRCGKEQVYTKFLKKAMKNEPLLYPEGLSKDKHPTRDCNVVFNYIDGIRKIIEQGKTGVFNLSSGKEMSILDLGKLIVDMVGKGEIKFTDKFEYRSGEVGRRCWLDISKAREELGYEPQMDLREGLKIQYRWMKNNPGYYSDYTH